PLLLLQSAPVCTSSLPDDVISFGLGCLTVVLPRSGNDIQALLPALVLPFLGVEDLVFVPFCKDLLDPRQILWIVISAMGNANSEHARQGIATPFPCPAVVAICSNLHQCATLMHVGCSDTLEGVRRLPRTGASHFIPVRQFLDLDS